MTLPSKPNKERLSQAVYDIVCSIPPGRATNYGAIAKAVGYPKLSRLIGQIMSECDSPNTGIPAHRVVNSQGQLSAREVFGSNTMQELLQEEGIVVVNNKIKNWKSIYWSPIDEINL